MGYFDLPILFYLICSVQMTLKKYPYHLHMFFSFLSAKVTIIIEVRLEKTFDLLRNNLKNLGVTHI